MQTYTYAHTRTCKHTCKHSQTCSAQATLDSQQAMNTLVCTQNKCAQMLPADAFACSRVCLLTLAHTHAHLHVRVMQTSLLACQAHSHISRVPAVCDTSCSSLQSTTLQQTKTHYLPLSPLQHTRSPQINPTPVPRHPPPAIDPHAPFDPSANGIQQTEGSQTARGGVSALPGPKRPVSAGTHPDMRCV